MSTNREKNAWWQWDTNKKCRLFFKYFILKLCQSKRGGEKKVCQINKLTIHFIIALQSSQKKVSPQTRFLSKHNLNANTNKITTFSSSLP